MMKDNLCWIVKCSGRAAERVGRLPADVTEGDKRAFGTAADGAGIDCARGARAPHDLYRSAKNRGNPRKVRWDGAAIPNARTQLHLWYFDLMYS